MPASKRRARKPSAAERQKMGGAEKGALPSVIRTKVVEGQGFRRKSLTPFLKPRDIPHGGTVIAHIIGYNAPVKDDIAKYSLKCVPYAEDGSLMADTVFLLPLTASIGTALGVGMRMPVDEQLPVVRKYVGFDIQIQNLGEVASKVDGHQPWKNFVVDLRSPEDRAEAGVDEPDIGSHQYDATD